MGLGFAPASGGGLSFGSAQGGNLSFKPDGSSGLSFAGAPSTDDSLSGKVSGFALSTLESFPELFGITPSSATEAYRAANPVSGFVSQLAGGFVPYLGAAKGLEAIPAAAKLIEGAGALGKSAFASGALRTATETALIEGGRLGISATGLPGQVYNAVTGSDQGQDQSLGTLAGGAAFNVLGGAALGGVFGSIGARLAKGPSIQELTGVGRDVPVLEQKRAVQSILDAHTDPNDPLTLTPDTAARLERENARLAQINLQDANPDFASTGEAINSGRYNVDAGRTYRDLEGDGGKTKIGAWLDKVTNWKRESPDKITSAARPIVDPIGGLRSPEERAAIEDALGSDFQGLAQDAQNIRVVTVKEGVGKRAPIPDLLSDTPTGPTPDLPTPSGESPVLDRTLKPVDAEFTSGAPENRPLPSDAQPVKTDPKDWDFQTSQGWQDYHADLQKVSSVQDALRVTLDHATPVGEGQHPEYEPIIQKVISRLDTLEAGGARNSFALSDNTDVAGGRALGYAQITPDYGDISVVVHNDHATPTIVLHEALHAATMEALRDARRTTTDLSGDVATHASPFRGALEELNQVWNHTVDAVTKEASDINRRLAAGEKGLAPRKELLHHLMSTNALHNEDELISWGLSDRRVQHYLEGLRYSGQKKTVWGTLVGTVRKLLGLDPKDDTVLARVLSSADKILSSPESSGLHRRNQTAAALAEPQAIYTRATMFDSTNPKLPRRLESDDEWTSGFGKKMKQDSNLARAKLVEKRLTTGAFAYAGEGFTIASEKDGLYVMAKKVRGELGKPAPGDQWVTFRTDNPAKFAPQAAKMFKEIKRGAFLPERPLATSSIGEQTFDTLGAYLDAYGKEVLPGKQGKAGALGSLVKESIKTAGTYLSPSEPLASRNPLLNLARTAAANLESHVTARVDELMHGAQDLVKGSLAKAVTVGTTSRAGLDAGIRTLSKGELSEVQGILMAEVPYKTLGILHERGQVSEGAFSFLSAMQSISDGFDQRITTVRQATVSNEATRLVEEWQTRAGHYGLTRDFSGPYKVRLLDESGELAGIAPGATPQEAREAAAGIIAKEAKETGRPLTDGGLIDPGLDPDEYRRMASAVRKPGFLKSRGTLLGYEYGRDELTAPKLSEIVEKNIRSRENYLRDIALWEKIKPLENELRRTSPQDAQALRSYLERLGTRKNLEPGSHAEGAFARSQNAIMDKALKSVGFSGGDSASQIVRVTQRTLSEFQFNFANIMQPIQNLVGIFQTLLPEVSFVTRASEETLARHYVSMPIYNQGGLHGGVGVLSDLKVFGQAMHHMLSGNPQPELSALTKEMVRRGVLAPRFAEEQFGSSGQVFRQWREATQSPGGFLKLFSAANQFLVGKSEELNRLATVSSAYQLAKLRGITDFNQLSHFTAEMIGKVNYGYSVADRAKLFTTPLGTLMGTFKNWQFHFLASMIKYATGGKEALPALLWQTAATGIFGGAVAMPLVMPVADGVSKFLTHRKAMETAYEGASEHGIPSKLVDGIMYGLPGALGVSLSSSVSEPGADPARDATMIFSFAAADRMKALSGGVSAAIANYATNGTSPFEDDNVRNQLLRGIAPRSIFRTMQVAQDSSLRSLSTGNPILSNVGLGDRMLYAMGFSPTELEKTYYAYNEIKDDQVKQKALVKDYGEALSHALESGDSVAAARTYTRAMALGIDGSRVLRSAQSRQKADQITQIEAAVKAKDRQGWGFAFDAATGQEEEAGQPNAPGALSTPGLGVRP